MNKLTFREIAKVLNVHPDTIRNYARKLFPEKLKQGVQVELNEAEITFLKQEMNKNYSIGNVSEVTTELEEAMVVFKALEIMKGKIDKLQIENIEMRPKAIAYDAFMSSHTASSMFDVAKVLKIGRNTLFKLLREHKILNEHNVPYQDYMKYFEVIYKPVPKGSIIENKPVTLVKSEGVDYLAKKFNLTRLQ